MATQLRVLEAHRLVILEFIDELGAKELSDFEASIESSEIDTSDFNILVVFQPDIDITLSSNNLREFARHKLQFSTESLRVIVATEQVLFGVARMYASEAYEITDRFHVFNSLEPACELLGVSVDAQSVDFADENQP